LAALERGDQEFPLRAKQQAQKKQEDVLLALEEEELVNLVDLTDNLAVEDEVDEETLHLLGSDVQLLRQERDLDSSVRLDDLSEL
jgi:hypothetical protein